MDPTCGSLSEWFNMCTTVSALDKLAMSTLNPVNVGKDGLGVENGLGDESAPAVPGDYYCHEIKELYDQCISTKERHLINLVKQTERFEKSQK